MSIDEDALNKTMNEILKCLKTIEVQTRPVVSSVSQTVERDNNQCTCDLVSTPRCPVHSLTWTTASSSCNCGLIEGKCRIHSVDGLLELG